MNVTDDKYKQMKKIFFGILAVSIVACKKTEPVAPVDYTLFSGTIKNANSNGLSIMDASNKSVREIKVTDAGTFSDTIFNASGHYRFSDGTENSALYLKNGYDLKLNMDAKEFDETIVYTGKGSNVNNYLAQKVLIEEKSGDMKELYTLDEAEFLAKMKQQKETLEQSLKPELDADFVAFEKENINYEHISNVIAYEAYHRYLSKNREFKVSESFPDLAKDLVYDNEEHFKSYDTYKRLVSRNFNKLAFETSEKEEIPFATAAIDIIKNSKDAQIIKNYLLSELSDRVDDKNPSAEQLFNDIIAHSTDSDFKEKLTKKYENIKKLVKGNASPVFVDYENSAGGTTSLADLKGKYVYIDVWATWCGPCKAEIPHLKKVEKQYHGKNIEFVSISVDTQRNHDKWKKMIADRDLGGIQLLADKDFKSEFVQNYNINGIPRFILLDPEGNIVSSDAPRPSDKRLISMFEELKI